MLFSFRSSDAAKYPKLLSVQTIAFALNERDAARMVKKGLATYDRENNSFNFMEFEKPRVKVIGSASAWPDVIGSEGFIDNPILVSQRVLSGLQREGMTGFRP